MGESIPFGDLIVLGAVALFIILRYRSVLGQKSGKDYVNKRPDKAEKDKKQFILLDKAKKPSVDDEAALTGSDNPELAAGVAKMKSIDPQFSVNDFLNGAKGAFDMVISAFNTHDRETLERLLAKDVYESFEASIVSQEEKGQKAITTLVALKSAELVYADVKKTQASITVQFISEQVHIVRDKDNKLVEGDASRVEDIADEWTFERDLKSRDPNWVIVAT